MQSARLSPRTPAVDKAPSRPQNASYVVAPWPVFGPERPDSWSLGRLGELLAERAGLALLAAT